MGPVWGTTDKRAKVSQASAQACRVGEKQKVGQKKVEKRVQKLIKLPDKPSGGYKAIVKNFEWLMRAQKWVNEDGSIYLVQLGNLQRYVAHYETKVKPQSLMS